MRLINFRITLFIMLLFHMPMAVTSSSTFSIDELLHAGQTLREQALEDYLAQFAAHHPHNPVIEGERVLLLLDPGTNEKTLQGDFNSWGRYTAPALVDKDSQMYTQTLGDSDWQFLLTTATSSARIQYALADSDGQPSRDPRNLSSILSFGLPASEFRMPDFTEVLMAIPVASSYGRLESLELTTSFDQKTRKVTVYLPPAYEDDGQVSYPSTWFNDGSAYLERMHLKDLLDQMISAGLMPAVIAVFMDPENRREDYRRSEAYRRYVQETAIPFVSKHYSIQTGASSRTIFGSSRGALSALDLTMGDAPLFQQAGLLTPALTPTSINNDFLQQGGSKVSYYLVGGQYDQRFLGDYYNLLESMLSTGTTVTARTFPEGHNQIAWRRQLPEMLLHFYNHSYGSEPSNP